MYRLIIRNGNREKFRAEIQKLYFKRLWLTFETRECSDKRECKQFYKTTVKALI